MKTEYRLKKRNSCIGNLWLQFKDLKGVWRYVPKELTATLGYSITQKGCPRTLTDLSSPDDLYYFHCFYNQENYNVIPFTKKYSNIEDYFELRRKQREKYLEKEKITAKKYKDDIIPI